MLLFKPEHVPLILKGIKTQTRRIWKANHHLKIGSIQLAKTQMLSKEYFAKLRILRIWKEPLNAISLIDCMKEGYETIPSYLAKFQEINGNISLFTIVDCIEFKVEGD